MRDIQPLWEIFRFLFQRRLFLLIEGFDRRQVFFRRPFPRLDETIHIGEVRGEVSSNFRRQNNVCLLQLPLIHHLYHDAHDLVGGLPWGLHFVLGPEPAR